MSRAFAYIADRVLAEEGGLVEALDRALEAEAHRAGMHAVDPVPASHRNVACSQAGCTRVAFAGGLCNAHYIRKRTGKDMSRPLRATQSKNCKVCGKEKNGKGGWGMCGAHYTRHRRAVLKSAAVRFLGGQCNACAQSFPLAVYDFHHPGDDKEDHPSYLLSNSSTEAIAREISKCVLLCANCHRIEHAIP